MSKDLGAAAWSGLDWGGRSQRLLVPLLAVVTVAALGCAATNDESTTAPPILDSQALVAGQTFVDPQGTYTMSVGPDWTFSPERSMAAEIELWFVAEDQDGFTPNVNVLTQAAPGMDAADYLEFSIENTPPGFELIDQEVIEGGDGQPLATMEYSAEGLHFYGVFAVAADQAVVATLSAPADRFEALYAEVRPFLLTLTRSTTE